MAKIPEEVLQNIWPHLQRLHATLRTSEGQHIEVISPGTRNRDAGPDFLNATLKIDGITWCGDVEIHVLASDWMRHKHHLDPAYNAVVLHVVAQNDHTAITEQGHPLVTMEFPDLENLTKRYESLAESPSTPRCGKAISSIAPIKMQAWLTRVLVERLEEKSRAIIEDAARCELGWEESFYRSLARSLGLRVNGEPMFRLAQSVPLKVLYKSRDSLATLEAILLGQSGLLEEKTTNDAYISTLIGEHSYHAKKNGLTPIRASEWRYMRIRPSAFPAIRISQLASLIYRTKHLFSKAIGGATLTDIESLFAAQASPYWEGHHKPSQPSKSVASKRLGPATIRIITLNTVIPYRFAYAIERGDETLQESTIALLESAPPEENSIVRTYADAGLKIPSAMETQAIIQLNKKYCNPRLCYLCPVGFHLLTQERE